MKNLSRLYGLVVATLALLASGCVEGVAMNASVDCSMALLRFNDAEREACRTGVLIAQNVAINMGRVKVSTLPWVRQKALDQAFQDCNTSYSQQQTLVGACINGVHFFERRLLN